MKQNQTSEDPNWLPVSAIAKLLGLTPRRIQQLVQLGEIPAGRRGRYPLIATVQGYCRYMQNLAAERSDSTSAHAVEVLKQRAAKLRIENELAAEQFIPRADVIAGIEAVNAHIRSRLLAIPAKAAPEALAAESVGDVKLALQEHIHAALDELSRTRFVAVGEDNTPATKRRHRRKSAKNKT